MTLNEMTLNHLVRLLDAEEQRLLASSVDRRARDWLTLERLQRIVRVRENPSAVFVLVSRCLLLASFLSGVAVTLLAFWFAMAQV